jgi:hypothetical protein
VKFYFPDSQDLVSPTYDFLHDEYSPLRVRQRDDLYAHEVLDEPPYDGLLVSKAIVDGTFGGAGKYSQPQRQRLYRLGVRNFFRLPPGVETLGDCGAFNYVGEHRPPYTIKEVVDFYEGCGFDSGVSVDHIILGYADGVSDDQVPADWVERQEISLALAAEFIDEIRHRKSSVAPVGAAQGWSPRSYARSVRTLQEHGYERIALGGMVPLKTPEILACLAAIDDVRKPGTELHLLGITRVDAMETFSAHGVTSFDSTSAFRQAFMDDRNNYYTLESTYVAVRIPQVDGNAALRRAILGGAIDQRHAVQAERTCLRALRAYDRDEADLGEALGAVASYEAIVGADKKKRGYLQMYERTLSARPWKECPCALCREHGVEIAIFRGTERNKRRGFHNLSVLERRMKRIGQLDRVPRGGTHG